LHVPVAVDGITNDTSVEVSTPPRRIVWICVEGVLALLLMLWTAIAFGRMKFDVVVVPFRA